MEEEKPIVTPEEPNSQSGARALPEGALIHK